ncbi:MAG: diadenylate cyclase [Bacteroides sp.]|jgi:hypothetical protein
MATQSLISVGILDVVDILLVAFLIYKIFKMARGTTAVTIFWAISSLYAIWVAARALNMELTSTILGQVMGVGLLALIVVFQQEIRRFLLYVGNYYKMRQRLSLKHLLKAKLLKPKGSILSELAIVELTDGCAQMGIEHTGALIAIARKESLQEFIATGVRIDALIKARLIENVFFKNSPLHDGALIIHNNRLEAAQCILPVSSNNNIPKRLGLRHRAAVGLAEITDAILVVVSEETGAISLFYGDSHSEGLTPKQLQQKLTALLT